MKLTFEGCFVMKSVPQRVSVWLAAVKAPGSYHGHTLPRCGTDLMTSV